MTPRRRFVSRLCAHTFVSSLLDESSVVVDLGLNQGLFARQIMGRFGCRVYGLEPVPELFEALKSQPGLIAEQRAIGPAAGEGTIHIFGKRCATLAPPLAGETARSVTVETTTLPDFLTRHSLSRIDLLKVDIEGAELEMLESIPESILQAIRQMTVEFHDFLYPETAPVVRERIRDLRLAGFHPVRFSRDNQDVLFLNLKLIPNALMVRLLLDFWYRPGLALVRKLRRRFGNTHSDHF
jgi:FkbM family methyltransferase